MSEWYRSFVVVSQPTADLPIRSDLHRPDRLLELRGRAELAEWIGYDVGSLTVAETAAASATRAWQRSTAEFSPGSPDWAGVGCRVVVATEMLRGAIVVHTRHRTDLLQWQQPVGDESRSASVTARLLESVVDSLSRGERPDPAMLADIVPGVTQRSAGAAAEIRELLTGAAGVVWRQPHGELTRTRPNEVGAVLSGAFNPLHEGHAALRRAAAEFLGVKAAYELPIVNADKPPIDFLSLQQRIEQFIDAPLALSRAATFAEKVRVMPRMTFVVGFDTAARIVEPRYYGGIEAMLESLRQFGEAGGSFLVAGRLCDGEFRSLADLSCPGPVRDLFAELPAGCFRKDVSSTELRRHR